MQEVVLTKSFNEVEHAVVSNTFILTQDKTSKWRICCHIRTYLFHLFVTHLHVSEIYIVYVLAPNKLKCGPYKLWLFMFQTQMVCVIYWFFNHTSNYCLLYSEIIFQFLLKLFHIRNPAFDLLKEYIVFYGGKKVLLQEQTIYLDTGDINKLDE